MTRGWLPAAGIVLVCLLCYGNSLDGSFHYDDFHSIVENAGIRSTANIPAFFVDPGLFSADASKRMYRPLLLCTYALNYAVGEYETRGYHLVNLFLHAACCLLVWALAGHLLVDRRPALLAALLFAVHPLATEPVNYISSRSELLMACFFLLACLAYLRFGRDGSKAWYAVALAAGGLALLSKSVAVVLVALLVAWDGFSGGRSRVRRRWRYYLPFVALDLLYVVFTWRLVDRALGTPVRALDAQVWTQAKAVAYYAKLVLAPWPQNVEHQFFDASGPVAAAVLGGIGLAASLAVLAGRAFRRGSIPGFGLAWSALVLLPASLVPLNMLVNERRLYLALVGFAWIGGHLSRLPRGWLIWASLPLLAATTLARNNVWQDELSLWRDAVRTAPRMYRAQTNLGKALQLSGDPEAALLTYQRALELDPRPGDAYNNIATIYHQQSKAYQREGRSELAGRRLTQAISWYRQALARYPDYEQIYQNLGDAHAQAGELDEAVAMYRRAVEIDDRNGAIWSNYGQTLYRAGQLAGAEEALMRAVELGPEQAEPYNNLGNVHEARGELARAVEMYEQALARQPTRRAEVLGNLGDTYRKLDRLDEARTVLEQALSLAPDDGRLHHYLGRLERQTGNRADAIAAFRRAARLDTSHAASRAEGAELLAAAADHSGAAQLFAEAVRIDPAYARAWYGLARSQEAMGARAAALQAYRAFAAAWPHRDQRYRQALGRIARLEEGR